MILCRRGNAGEALTQLRRIMGRLGLVVNDDKTRICKVPEESFDFLGYTFGRLYSAETGRAYHGMQPSKKSAKRMVRKLHAMTRLSLAWLDTTQMLATVRLLGHRQTKEAATDNTEPNVTAPHLDSTELSGSVP